MRWEKTGFFAPYPEIAEWIWAETVLLFQPAVKLMLPA